MPALAKEFPDVSVLLEGEEKEGKTAMRGMAKAFLIGIFGVFIILSLQFRSYFEPIIVMILIPFALIGVIWGHLLLGLDLTMPSIMGFISLAGIMVNDSILLVTFIRSHMERGEAAIDAAKLASSLVFGLLTTTVLVLLVIPALYAVFDDFRLLRKH